MPLVKLDDRRTEGMPLPFVVTRDTFGGKTFAAGRRTFAHLRATDDAVRAQRIGCFLRVIQGCFNTGVPASAGTHDGDGCLDVQIVGMEWGEAQGLLRRNGWAAWYREATPGLWGDHIHMVSLGCPGPVGVFVPGQVDDYYAHRSGLKGHASDPTWHPDDIDSTVFDYPAWIAEQEDNMPYTDWPQKDRDALIKDVSGAVVRDLLAAVLDGSKLTVRHVLERLGKAFDRNGKPKP